MRRLLANPVAILVKQAVLELTQFAIFVQTKNVQTVLTSILPA